MAGNDPSGIFHPVAALEHRFKEVTDLTARAENQTDPGGEQPGERRKPENFCQKSADQAADQTADRPFDTLFRTDRRVKTVFADGRTDEIGDGIAQHHDQEDGKDPFPPLREGPQQDEMAEQEGEIKVAEEDRGAVPGNRLDRAVTKEEEGGNAKCGRGKGPGRQAILQIKSGNQSGADHRRKVMLKAAHGREGHAIKFIEGNKDDDGNSCAEEGRCGAPHQQDEEGEEDDPGNNPLFNKKSP